MTDAASQAHPDETGGILVGVFTRGHPWVITAVEIPSLHRGHTHYLLPADTTRAAVLHLREHDARLGYLGDWHSHPRDVGPSSTDLASLTRISLSQPRVPNPTQIVVRRTRHGYDLDARRIVTCVPRVCRIDMTGPLPVVVPDDTATRTTDSDHRSSRESHDAD
jgi:proteasome lid subunit RPN8/RPN11